MTRFRQCLCLKCTRILSSTSGSIAMQGGDHSQRVENELINLKFSTIRVEDTGSRLLQGLTAAGKNRLHAKQASPLRPYNARFVEGPLALCEISLHGRVLDNYPR
jgi:hypothetical protein